MFIISLELFFGLILVLWGANLLIDSSILLGKRLNISETLIGIIVVGFGTSLSELLVSIDAVIKNAPELSLGNIIGSNIANIFLVLGFSGFFSRIIIPRISKIDLFFQLFSIISFYLIFTFFKLNLISGIIFILFFFLYLFFSINNLRNDSNDYLDNTEGFFNRVINTKPFIFGIPIILTSIAVTLLGADLTVLSAIKISKFYSFIFQLFNCKPTYLTFFKKTIFINLIR